MTVLYPNPCYNKMGYKGLHCDCINLRYHICSNILNFFLFLFLNKMFVFRAGIYKKLVTIANREDHA